MAMSSYEVVKRAIDFRTPDRLPLSGWGPLSDFHGVGWNQIGTGDHRLRQTFDEWGCTWHRSEVENMGLVKGHPLQEWKSLDRYHWPDPDDPAFFSGMEDRFQGSEGKYISTGIFMLLFERMHTLHGFAETLADLYLERGKIEMLADRIVDFDLRIIENIAGRFPGQIHGFGFTDDWGTQQNLMIKPSLWDDFFLPRYKKIFDACHCHGWTVHMHSCGKVNAILESLISIGLDAANLLQPRLLGIEEVGRQFAGRICFESLCDIQHTLPIEDSDAIYAEAELLMRCWGTPAGGFILVDYGDDVAVGVPQEKRMAMLKDFLDQDPWKKQSGSQGNSA